MQNYYDLLRINAEELRKKEEAEIQQQIEKAFRKMALVCHPDKTGGNDEEFKAINEARLVLLDRKRRLAYDEIEKQKVQTKVYDPHLRPEQVPHSDHHCSYYHALCDLSIIQSEYEAFIKSQIGKNGIPKEHGYASSLSYDTENHHDILSLSFPNESQKQAFADLMIAKGYIKDPGILQDEQEAAKSRPNPFGNLGATPRNIKE